MVCNILLPSGPSVNDAAPPPAPRTRGSLLASCIMPAAPLREVVPLAPTRVARLVVPSRIPSCAPNGLAPFLGPDPGCVPSGPVPSLGPTRLRLPPPLGGARRPAETPRGRTRALEHGIPDGSALKPLALQTGKRAAPRAGTAGEGCAWGTRRAGPECSVRSHHRPDLDPRFLTRLPPADAGGRPPDPSESGIKGELMLPGQGSWEFRGRVMATPSVRKLSGGPI
ncbi:unnamed protein product [Rangifer tarandus platyrhynchus]|uniref:Uncharacterized protein n=1 Tax=Rangifer tarandus platyrhynchus TaxID=3082113 RepID=A0ABN8ZCS4_RANTA|nr:unnamed protein product [Rangifer tarandus platyrhynchus]CAI9688789.1 unnamed protein product [Rangifer tarandus platyrhynchus]